ncbi:hypothetical protein V8J88_23870 [Massilia sp. W12]|uniref:hypothetical protein n=1 Tax=Massilia sp. W12 TaxID=3126507 RepID=UPI0030D51533
MSDLQTLEAEGKIKIYTSEQVKEILKADKKLAKKSGDAVQIMRKNNEVLVHGEIPSSSIGCCKK